MGFYSSSYSCDYLFIKNILAKKEIYRFEIVTPDQFDSGKEPAYEGKLIIYLRDKVYQDKYPNLDNQYYLSCYFRQHQYCKKRNKLLCIQSCLNEPIKLEDLINKKIKSIVRIKKRSSFFQTIDDTDIYVIEMTDGIKMKLLSTLLLLNYDIIKLGNIVDNLLLREMTAGIENRVV